VNRPEVLIDCDPGHDDVVALIVASRFCEIVAITTVNGNASVADCTRNALCVAELFGIHAPVHAGCATPLVQAVRHAAHVHGESGLGGTTLPPTSRTMSTGHAVEVLIESTRAREGLWLIPTGPLTNVAVAMRLDPGLAARVSGLSLMGGGIRFGNVNATAEFNIFCDPEAAHVVFHSGAPLRMCGLDVTHQVRVGSAEVQRLRALSGDRGRFLADILDFFSFRYEQLAGRSGGPMHDPLAVLAVTHHDHFRFVNRSVEIELAGGQRGMTVVDQRDLATPPDSNCLVAEAVDAQALLNLIMETLEIASMPDVAPGDE
jgi:inosine-uridine nucleoside N-ribohydrolase